MSQQEYLRRKGRDAMVRVIADQYRSEGKALPDMREVERQAHAVADRNDRKKDEGR